MKNYQFRGKRLSNGEWVQGSYVYAHKFYGTGEAGHFIYDIYGEQRVLVKSETVGQFSGLTDKNRKEIFENDILEVAIAKQKIICKVIFQDGAFVGIDESGCECDFRYLANVEVIGNIFDNPELWKGVNE